MRRYSINYNGQSIEFEIVHRPAVTRRIHLEISGGGGLQVVAPRRMSRRSVRHALQEKAHHVALFLIKARSRQQELPEFRYYNGEEHLFLGRQHALEIVHRQGVNASIDWSGQRIRIVVPGADAGRVSNLLQGWYRKQAQAHFAERLAWFNQAAAWTGRQPPVMRLRRMKRTWGSCSAKGVITLNPHLVKAPPRCIDYVIAHEICHLREHNHGPGFYLLQERLYPGWREAKELLTSRGHLFLHH